MVQAPDARQQFTCSIQGCLAERARREFCWNHYNRARASGILAPRPTLEERFWAKVQIGEDCWLWTASVDGHGYGQLQLKGRGFRAHRLAYEMLIGPILPNLDLDHLCRNPLCVRPDHMEPVTHLENVRRGRAGWNSRAKTHCPQNHPYDAERMTRDGLERFCRICARDASRRWKEKQKTS